MSDTAIQVRDATLTLPANAPLVRITAGLGSAGQKTWNLKRAVTLLGSRRPAHIVLHDRNVSGAHCVIVHTGTDILLKDLRSRSGTFCNSEPVTLTALKDGDVITVGETRMQVAIQVPADACDDSGAGMTYEDPLRFSHAVTVKLLHTDRVWDLEDAVVLVGKQEGSIIHLDHEEVAARHAVLFRFGPRPAVFDLGAPSGLWVNGQRCSLTPLDDGDCLTVGPFGLSVHFCDPTGPAKPKPEAAVAEVSSKPAAPKPVDQTADDEPSANGRADKPAPAPSAPAPAPAAGVDLPPPDLDSNISDMWERLNQWQSRLAQNASALNKHESDLAARASELDAKDAALRGQLHDLTRLNDRISQRERELARLTAQQQTEKDELTEAQKKLSDAKAEFERRAAELQRREHAVTQRWSRMMSATCPHCGKPINVGQTGGAE